MTARRAAARYALRVRAIVLLACMCATGCELYFGPGDQDAAPTPTPDAFLIVPDAATITRPDPPASCSTTKVYVQTDPSDPRGPFVAALIKDALAFYHVPIVAVTTDQSDGLTIALLPTAVGGGASWPQCTFGGASVGIGDGRGQSNEQIVAQALYGVGVMLDFPKVTNAGDCMADIVTPGCTFGRAQTVESDPCGLWPTGTIDEAQLVSYGLGCPGI